MSTAKGALKVGFIVDDTLDKPDGVQQYVLAVGRWLAAHGHDVHYIVGQSMRTDVAHVHSMSKNVAVRFNGNHLSMPLPASRQAIAELLRQQAFDVLHVQTPHSPFMAQRIIMQAPDATAIVSTFHILPHTALAAHLSKALRLLLRPSLRRIDAFIAVSSAAAEFARQSLGVHAAVLPNTIDVQPFRRAKAFARYRDKPLIVYLGRLEERKGCIYLLRAIDYMVNTSHYNEPFRVIICGKGPERNSLELYVRQHGLQDIVHFEGFVSEADKPRYLASADVVVYPSTSGESFGIVLLEGMAASRGIVLAGDNPGYASVMEPFPSQLLDVRNTNTFATLLVRSLRDGKLRQAASRSQKQYAQGYDISTVGPQILSVYRSILQAKR